MNFTTLLVGLACAVNQAPEEARRAAEFDRLSAEYQAAEKKYWESPSAEKLTAAEQIRLSEAWPGWQYIPQFLELAEAWPDDEISYRCCMWLCDRMRNVGNGDKRTFAADEKAWQILSAHHAEGTNVPQLCFRAVEYNGPAREEFLRGLIARPNLPREHRGFATVALAEKLAIKHEGCDYRLPEPPGAPRDEYSEYLSSHKSAEAVQDLIPANSAKFKAASISLFKEVLANYADVPVTFSAPHFRSLHSLGDKAAKSLHALEHLEIGCELPNTIGKDLQNMPLDLASYRGKVVVISVWFTGCGPCMGMVPQEQRLVKSYEGRPFALLGVCCDDTIESGQKTAAEHQMDWPCWFDGEDGPIARNLNVLHWPMTYVLDQHGIIAAKDLRDQELDAKVAELMREK